MKCPSCGAEASGKFCSSCGAPLVVEKCPSCAEVVPPGSKFCTHCGKPMPGAGKSGRGKPGAAKTRGKPAAAGTREKGAQGSEESPKTNSTMAWWVAGVLLVITLVALGYPVLNRGANPGAGSGPGGMPPGMGGAGTGSGLVDLSTMSLEEQATRTFNRVMSAKSQGDTASVAFFLPMALTVYQELNATDPDSRYHVALLHMAGGDAEAALATAREGLADEPDYVLLLGVGAEAAVALGDDATARQYYTHLLEVYDTELGMSRVGYDHHQPMFPAYREAARAFLGQG